MQEHLRAGGYLVGRPVFGYKADKLYDVLQSNDKSGRHSAMTPTDLGRKYVPEIFARVIAGDSLATVCAWLDSKHVASPSGGKWSPRSLAQLIRNTSYVGYRRDASGRTILRCEALVTADVQARAIERLDNARGRRTPAVY